jgi:hypothetical protein
LYAFNSFFASPLIVARHVAPSRPTVTSSGGAPCSARIAASSRGVRASPLPSALNDSSMGTTSRISRPTSSCSATHGFNFVIVASARSIDAAGAV